MFDFHNVQVNPTPYNKPIHSARGGRAGGGGGGRMTGAGPTKAKKIEVKGVEPALVDLILNEIEDK